MEKVTALEDQIIKIANRDKPEKGLVICALLASREYDLEQDVQNYLDGHPDCSFMELGEYIISLCPPLEIVDDDEMDEED